VKNVLGYSVTVFLQSLPYSLFRLVGADPWLAFELVLFVFSCIGFGATYYLISRFLRTGPLWSAGGAFLFTFSNSAHIWITSPHLYHVMLLPLILTLALLAFANWNTRRTVAAVCAVAAVSIFGLLFLSEFYTAWFTGVFLLFVCFFAAVLHPRWLATRTRLVGRRELAFFAALALIGALALWPFFVTYSAAISSGKLRTLDSLTGNTIGPSQIIHVGTTMWSGAGYWRDSLSTRRRTWHTGFHPFSLPSSYSPWRAPRPAGRFLGFRHPIAGT
jgi:hypothetical protein